MLTKQGIAYYTYIFALTCDPSLRKIGFRFILSSCAFSVSILWMYRGDRITVAIVDEADRKCPEVSDKLLMDLA